MKKDSEGKRVGNLAAEHDKTSNLTQFFIICFDLKVYNLFKTLKMYLRHSELSSI